MMEEESKSKGEALSAGWRLFYAIFGIGLPVVSFAVSDILAPDWQDGNLNTYLEIVLGVAPVKMLFYPILGFSLVMFGLVLALPDYSRYFIARLGVYSYLILSFQYALILSFGIGEIDGLLAFLPITFGTVYLVRFVFLKIQPWLTKNVALKIALGVVFVLVLVALLIGDAFFGAILLLIFGPATCFVLTLNLSTQLYKDYDAGRLKENTLLILAWVVAYIATIRITVYKSIDYYNSLPTEPPDCYITTAAASGHHFVVKSKREMHKNGVFHQVNAQMQHFKALELVLMILFPSFHRIFRKVYDSAGRRMAKFIKFPLLADLAYLILKPIEWIVWGCLKMVFPKIEKRAGQIYKKH